MLQETSDYIEKTDIHYRKKNGQYFTNDAIKDILFSSLPSIQNGASILEPSAGTGEFISSILDINSNVYIDAIEIDAVLCNTLKEKFGNKVHIIHGDALQQDLKKYDYIIGNPPYFEVKLSKDEKENFSHVIYGRVNIYTLFFKLAIDAVKENGYIAFVVPTSMNSGAYFTNLRKYIILNTNIENIIQFNDKSLFDGAEQSVQIIILKKTKNNGNHIISIHGNPLFVQNKNVVEEIYKNSISLFSAGYKVKTGSVVWNTHKNLLTNNNDNTLLLWSKNISNDGKYALVKFDAPKGQYIKLNGTDPYPSIAINRIIGDAKKPHIKFCYMKNRFFAENHINLIYRDTERKQIISFDDIMKQLSSKRIYDAIRYVIGNTQLSKSEILYMLPFN